MNREYINIDSEIQELEYDIQASGLVPLTKIITRKGKLKGELHHMTKKQYRDFMGREPRQSIVIKGIIPWHLALDEIAQEKGYKSDESLKDAIENTRDKINKLEDLKVQRRNLKHQNIINKNKPEIVKSDNDFNAPVYPKDEKVKSVFTSLGNNVVLSKRNPPFWQVEYDDKRTDKMPDEVFRVRYSKDADKLTRIAIRQKSSRITPKMPRLR